MCTAHNGDLTFSLFSDVVKLDESWVIESCTVSTTKSRKVICQQNCIAFRGIGVHHRSTCTTTNWFWTASPNHIWTICLLSPEGSTLHKHSFSPFRCKVNTAPSTDFIYHVWLWIQKFILWSTYSQIFSNMYIELTFLQIDWFTCRQTYNWLDHGWL